VGEFNSRGEKDWFRGTKWSVAERSTSNRNYKYFANTNLLKNTDGSSNIYYTHDKNGNVTYSTTKYISLSYDPYFNLTTLSIDDEYNNIGTFFYGAHNERVLKQYLSYDHTFKTFYFHGLSDYPLVEKNYQGSTLVSTTLYIYGPTGLVAIKDGSQNLFVIKDHLGSRRVVINSSCSRVAKYHYSPYGRMMYSSVSTDVAYKFTGQEFDDETGLHNFRARLYDAEIGMFYAYDPAAQGFSPFGYCGNNPVIYIDKDGRLFGIDDLIIIGAVAVGYLAGAAENHWEMNPGKWDWKSADTYKGLFFGLAMGGVGGAVAVGANLRLGVTLFSGISKPIASFAITLGNLATPAMYISSAVVGVGGVSILGYYAATQTWNNTDKLRYQLNDVRDFTAGTISILSFGATDLLFGGLGDLGTVNYESAAYETGEWVGVAGSTLIGGVSGWTAAGKKAVGKEFSHWIPKRTIKLFGEDILNFGKTKWNGNFVSKELHALSDQFRHRFMPKIWKEMNPIYPSIIQQGIRIPYVYDGIFTGFMYGIFSK
jgi:RHS repeat-associated protein